MRRFFLGTLSIYLGSVLFLFRIPCLLPPDFIKTKTEEIENVQSNRCISVRISLPQPRRILSLRTARSCVHVSQWGHMLQSQLGFPGLKVYRYPRRGRWERSILAMEWESSITERQEISTTIPKAVLYKKRLSVAIRWIMCPACQRNR